MGMGHKINWWGIYDSNGWGSYGSKVSNYFLEDMQWSSGEYPFRSSHDHGFGPFELPTYSLLQKGLIIVHTRDFAFTMARIGSYTLFLLPPQ